MSWTLNSSNPKRMLLLSLGLMGGLSVAYSGNLEAQVNVSNVGSGYASKHSAITLNHSSEGQLVGSKLAKSGITDSVTVSSNLLYRKKGLGSFSTATVTTGLLEFIRPNYFHGSIFATVEATPSFKLIPRRLGNSSKSVTVYSVTTGKKKIGNLFLDTVEATSNALGHTRYNYSFLTEVIVNADLNTLASIAYVEAACLSTKVVIPRILTVTVNNQCSCKILLGQSVKLECTIKDSDGVVVDPTELELTIVRPTGQRETLAINQVVKEAVGNYSFSFLPDLEGLYLVRWFSEGNYQGLVETSFLVSKGMV